MCYTEVMALIIPPGYLHAVYEFTRTGDPETMVTTMGHEIDATSGASGADSADDLFTAFANEIMPTLSSQTTLTGVTTYVGQDGGTPLVYTSSAVAVAGSATNTLLPQNCALLVRKRTDAAGRRGRGRMYIPEVAELAVDDLGVLTGSYQSAVQGFFDAWLAYLTGGVGARLYPPVILHRSEGIGAEPLPTPVQALVLDSRIATQRRRLRP